jgi:hypothetical protein
VPLSRNLVTLTSWNPLGHSRPETGLLFCYKASEDFGVLHAYRYLGTNLTLYYLDTIDLIFLSFLEHNSYVIHLAWIVRVEQISACSTVNNRSPV